MRVANRADLTALIEDFLAPMTALEAAELLERAGIANGRLNEAKDVWDHPQLAARDRWREVATPKRGGARPAASVRLRRS